jgi:hypothetical protein
MAKLPGPWKVEIERIVASDGTLVMRVNRLGEIEMEPEAERLLLAFPKMLVLLMRLESLSKNVAAQLSMHKDHVQAISEIPAILSEFDLSSQLTPGRGSQGRKLIEGATFRFRDLSGSMRMLYGRCSRVPGRMPEVDASLVEWHEMADSPECRVAWTETMEGGAEGTWSRRREQVLDLRVPDDLASPDKIWTVTKIEPKQETCDKGSQSVGLSSTEEVIHVTAVTEHFIGGPSAFLVNCRFVLGDSWRGSRPLSSIQVVHCVGV